MAIEKPELFRSVNETVARTTSPSKSAFLHNTSSTEAMISNEITRIYQFIVLGVLCQFLDICGTVANIVNVICFIRLGFKNPVNVSLLGLSISDLLCLTTLIFTDMCYNPYFQEAELPFEATELQYLVAGWPHAVFARITSWLTALITLERCLCIMMPLKVKIMITSKRVAIINIILYVFLIWCGSPLYYANYLGWKFSPRRNKTILGLLSTPDRDIYEQITFGLNSVILPYGSFMIVIVCTIILVTNLQDRVSWRAKATISEKAQTTSKRDRKVAKMVVAISSLFIACFSPMCVVVIGMIFVPGLSVDGEQKNLLIVTGGFAFLLESINSTVNIFIYYQMSTKYRTVFRQLFNVVK